MRKPDVVIAGAMKSGTTTMHAWLREHPGAFMAVPKELHYFDLHYEKGSQWYLDHFAGASPEVLAGEGTPSYLYLPQAAERMGRDLPDAKIVILLRDPISRAYSHYHHMRRDRGERLDFGEAIRLEPERLKGADVESTLYYSYVDRGRYVQQVRRMLDLYPRDRVHFELFENLRDRPLDTFRRLAGFLRIDPSVVPKTIGDHANRYTDPRLRRVSRIVPGAGRALKLAARLNPRPPRAYAEMVTEDYQFLLETYLGERDELEELTDCDLSGWRR